MYVLEINRLIISINTNIIVGLINKTKYSKHDDLILAEWRQQGEGPRSCIYTVNKYLRLFHFVFAQINKIYTVLGQISLILVSLLPNYMYCMHGDVLTFV